MVRPLPGSYVFEANRILDAELGPESLHLVDLHESLSHPFRAFLCNFDSVEGQGRKVQRDQEVWIYW